MFSFWLHISFIFLFHLPECLKQREKSEKTPLLVPLFLPQTLTTWQSCQANPGVAAGTCSDSSILQAPPRSSAQKPSLVYFRMQRFNHIFPPFLPQSGLNSTTVCFNWFSVTNKGRWPRAGIFMVSDYASSLNRAFSFPPFQFKTGDEEVHKRKWMPLLCYSLKQAAHNVPVSWLPACCPLHGFSASPALHPGSLAGLQGAALIMMVLLCQMDYKWNHLWRAHKVTDKGWKEIGKWRAASFKCML